MQDIHTHLYWPSYDEDRDEVVARARAVGVREMVVVGCTVEESRQAVALTERYSDMYAAVGIHPHEMNALVENPKLKAQMPNKTQSVSFQTNEQIATWIESLRQLAKHEKVVAIGECGLDYYAHDATKLVTEEEKIVQRMGLLAHIDLARELSLPLILHCRTDQGKSDAYEDLFTLIQASDFPFPVVLHCYMGDTEVTKKFLTLPNVFFSFTGNITYPVKKAVVGNKSARNDSRSDWGRDDIRETVKLIPLDRIFAETDCPFLAPQSKRGKRNEPQYVTEVYTTIALLQDRTVDQVREAIEMNRRRVFTRMA